MKLPTLLITLLLTPVCYGANMAHSHLKHVYEAWHSNPEGIGFLPLSMNLYEQAAADAQAVQGATTAAQTQQHLSQLHQSLAGNKVNLSDALAGMVKHTALAAMSIDSSNAVVEYADAIAECTNNALRYATEAAAKVDEYRQDPATLTDPARAQLAAVTTWIYAGRDLNKDGTIANDGQECGLRQADVYFSALKHLEGLE